MLSLSLEKHSNFKVNCRQYLALCKPKVVLLLVLTAVTGMILAPVSPSSSMVRTLNMLMSALGIGLAASSAAVINHIIDEHIDKLMHRTKNRPIATGYVKPIHALIFSLMLLALAIIILLQYANTLATLLTMLGFIGYAIIYTVFLKHYTVHNIVWGGISGALPPLLGWVSVTNSLALEPILLTLLIFLWTPAHFWPLAIARIDDYRTANVPMMPVVKGVKYTQKYVLFYGLLTVICSLIPYFINWMGGFYLICACVLGAWFLTYLVKLSRNQHHRIAMAAFRVSIYYLLALFTALIVDPTLNSLFLS